MDRNKELLTAYKFWNKMCELQNILFDHYGSEFIDLYIDELNEEQGLEEDIDWPF